jgi:hypothetical protein
MKIGPIYFFQETNTPWHLDLPALRWDDSITWWFILSWHPRVKECRLGFYRSGRHCGVNIPVLGDFSFQWQDNMARRSKAIQILKFPESKSNR